MDKNKLKLYKLTKPDMFSNIFKEAYNDQMEYLQNQNKMQKKPHVKQWQSNVTDYFNYGFNEHTLQIYVHKITQLSEQYRKQRQQYIEKCESGNQPIFEQAKEMRKISKELFPIDLGGLFVAVDDKMIDIDIPLKENLFEQRFDRQEIRDMQDQYYCTGESLLYKSRFIQKITDSQRQRVQDVYKEQKKEGRDLYLLDQAVKIFPEQKQLTQNILPTWPPIPIPLPPKSRSRTPKKKNSK